MVVNNALRIFDILVMFPLPQVKRSVINSNKHDIYELPEELQNGFKS